MFDQTRGVREPLNVAFCPERQRSGQDRAVLEKSMRANDPITTNKIGGAPKERGRRRAEKRLSKTVFLESPFLLCPLKAFRCFKSKKTLRGQRRNGLSKNTVLDNRFSARRPLVWRALKNERGILLEQPFGWYPMPLEITT